FVRSASHAHGLFDMSDGFRLSENIYFAQVGLQIGAAKLTDYAKRFGIGSTPNLDLPAAKGQLSDSGSIDRPTLLADTSYGQGELLVEPEHEHGDRRERHDHGRDEPRYRPERPAHRP